jgi:SAM-dependent methyltransferase
MSSAAGESSMDQSKQRQWHDQWSLFEDDETFLFRDWIYPNTLDDFRGKTVLECGCGGGQHTRMLSPFAASITAVDLNTAELARERNRNSPNVSFVAADIATMSLDRQFDIVFSIGVVHHTDNPDKTVANLTAHVKPGGRLILWVYSKEGNALVEYLVEPIRRWFLRSLPSRALLTLSRFLCAMLYVPVYTVYLLPLPFLPFYEYFENFRRLSFTRNVLNVFDKLNAPQTQFISEDRVRGWFSEGCGFRDVHISRYCGVSWRGSATKC